MLCTRMPWSYITELLAWQTPSRGPSWRLKYCVGGTHWRVAFCHIRPCLLSNWHKTLVNSLLPPLLDSLWMWADPVHPPTNNMYVDAWKQTLPLVECCQLSGIQIKVHHLLFPPRGLLLVFTTENICLLKEENLQISCGSKAPESLLSLHNNPTTSEKLTSETWQESWRGLCCLNMTDNKSSRADSLNAAFTWCEKAIPPCFASVLWRGTILLK